MDLVPDRNKLPSSRCFHVDIKTGPKKTETYRCEAFFGTDQLCTTPVMHHNWSVQKNPSHLYDSQIRRYEPNMASIALQLRLICRLPQRCRTCERWWFKPLFLRYCRSCTACNFHRGIQQQKNKHQQKDFVY